MLKNGHSDLQKGVHYNLQAFRAELADFSANFPKLLEISPHYRTNSPGNYPPNNHLFSSTHHTPSPTPHHLSPTHQSSHHPAAAQPISPHSLPRFIPSFYTPIPPHSPGPNWPSNFSHHSNTQNHNETNKNVENFYDPTIADNNNNTLQTFYNPDHSNYSDNFNNKIHHDDFTNNNTANNHNGTNFFEKNSTIRRESSSRTFPR
jgi:hypothetical protein